MEIKNLHIEVNKTQSGIGARVLVSQIEHARKHGYETLKCTAYRRDDRNCVGYLIWAKLGYLMETRSLKKFKNFLVEHEVSASNLHDLQSSNKENEELWKTKGFTWRGKFFLEDESPSQIILKNYLDKKKAQN